MEQREVVKLLVGMTALLVEHCAELEAVREVNAQISEAHENSHERLLNTIEDQRERIANISRENEQLRAQLREAQPGLIARIRALRTLTGMDLKDSKAFLEALDKQVAQGGGGSAVADLSSILHRAAPSMMSASGGPNDTQGSVFDNGVPRQIS